MDMAKRGQPPKYGDAAAEARVSFRAPEDMKARWAARAKELGIPLSELIIRKMEGLPLPRPKKK